MKRENIVKTTETWFLPNASTKSTPAKRRLVAGSIGVTKASLRFLPMLSHGQNLMSVCFISHNCAHVRLSSAWDVYTPFQQLTLLTSADCYTGRYLLLFIFILVATCRCIVFPKCIVVMILCASLPWDLSHTHTCIHTWASYYKSNDTEGTTMHRIIKHCSNLFI